MRSNGSIVVIAGGGGGSGSGNGGGSSGSVGTAGGGVSPGGGATQTTGGTGGGGGTSGAQYSGGSGASSSWDGGGGGGGGYYGGGGGSAGASGGVLASAGGGGSSYATGTNSQYATGSIGNGQIQIQILSNYSQTMNMMEWQDADGILYNVMDRDGNLALGASTAGSYKLYVNGSFYATSGPWTTSDLRFKENILPLNNSLDKILSIQPVSFDWNKSGYPDMNFDSSRQIGLVAQEVEKQVPELVRTDTNGYKSIAYDKLTVVTIEAVKEQQKEIEELKAMLKETSRKQQKEIELLKADKEIRE